MTTTCNTCGENLPASANMSGMRWCLICGFSSKYEPNGDVKRLSDAAKQLRRERDEARTKYLQITSSQSQFFRNSAPERFAINQEFKRVSKELMILDERLMWLEKRRRTDILTTQTTLSWQCNTCERPMSRILKGPEAPKPSPETCDTCRLEELISRIKSHPAVIFLEKVDLREAPDGNAD